MKNKSAIAFIAAFVIFSSIAACYAEPAAAPAPAAKPAAPAAPAANAVPAPAPAQPAAPASAPAAPAANAPAATPAPQAPQTTAAAPATASEQAGFDALVARIKENNVITEETLPNGIKIVFKKNTSSDIIVVRLTMKAGSVFEDPAKNGVSCLMFDLIRKGNTKMKAEEIAKSIEMTGASFGTDVSKLEGSVNLVSTLKSFEKNFDVVADCVLAPTFPKEEFEKEKTFLAEALRSENDRMDVACSKLFYKTAFEGHPYSLHHYGSVETVPAITRDDVVKWHKTLFIPENMTFVVVGNTDMAYAKEQIAKRFGAMKKSEKVPALFEDAAKKIAAGAKAPAAPKEARELKDKAQCFIYMGFLTEGVESSDYGALKVLNTVLGAGMSSRLFSILRDKESLAYQITSYYQTLRGNSALIMLMGTQKQKYEQAISSLKREIDRFRTELITDEEYARARNKLVGTYALQRNTMSEQAQFLGTWEAIGLGAKFENQYLESVLSPKREDVQKVAQKYFDPAKNILAVIYPAEKKAGEVPKGAPAEQGKGKKKGGK